MFEKLKRNIKSLKINLIHVVYWILGFPTVIHSNGKFKMRGPSLWFQIILTICIIWERIDTMININVPIFRKSRKILGLMYMTMKIIELICTVTSWMVRSKYRSKEIIRFHTNLKDIDVLLMRKQYAMFENNSKMYYWYFFISSCYVACEKIKRGASFYKWLQTLKFLSMNMAFLYFFAQINECILRMKILIVRLNDMKSFKGDFVNFPDCYINLATAFDKIKQNVNIALKEMSIVVSFQNIQQKY